jgi:hypothetical protein
MPAGDYIGVIEGRYTDYTEITESKEEKDIYLFVSPRVLREDRFYRFVFDTSRVHGKHAVTE